METKAYIIIRIHKETHRKLRLIGALCDERLVATVERLATQEVARLETERANQQKGEHV